MKRIFWAILLVGVGAHAQTTVTLRCKGEVKESGDLNLNKTTAASASIDLNPETGTARINGSWGCVSNVAQEEKLKSADSDMCTGTLRMTKGSQTFTYSSGAENSEFRSTLFVEINRVNGNFQSTGYLFAKPAANMPWKHWNMSTTMECAVADKLF